MHETQVRISRMEGSGICVLYKPLWDSEMGIMEVFTGVSIFAS
jgi:hypothetical protein